MKGTLEQAATLLRSQTSVRIYYHKRPDGDAIGSSHALALALRQLGISAATCCCDPIPPIFEPVCAVFTQDEVGPDAFSVAVDTADPARLGHYQDVPISLIVDHHINRGFDDALKYVEEDASSCCELILKLLEYMHLKITPQIADFLYTGLVTDTLCFRTASTNTDSMCAAARLAAYGADIVTIARHHCLYKTPARIRIESILQESFHFTSSGKVLGCMYHYEDLQKLGITDADLDGLNAVVEQVEAADLGIVVREIAPKFCRVSVRSKGKYDANLICRSFGGGGHPTAAGGEFHTSPEEALRHVEECCRAFIEAQDKCPSNVDERSSFC